MYRLDRRNKIISYGRAHFWFELGGKTYGYCYIRKNACSAFKKLICDTSDVADFSAHKGTELQFMEAHHRIRNYDQLKSCDHLIFVYRDPYDRLVSTYVNKFVVQTGHAEIFKSYQQQTGKAPEKASFRDFVVGYCKEFREKDVHIFPQHLHLMPARYDGVLSIDSLYDDITELMGKDVAETYFARKANRSDYGKTDDPKADIPCGQLNKEYAESGQLPSKDAFFDEDLEQVVKRRYSKDYQMISGLRAV
ncbi:MAG: sulfotransferase family 2 domain-containing protein [Pseudooceanicola atlanticus]